TCSDQLRLLISFITTNFDDHDHEQVDLERGDGPPEYPGQSAIEMVTDYLTKVREHAYGEIAKQYGEAMFRSMRKELVVTIPAVWSEMARDSTLKAVVNANFAAAKTSLVTEPEAAAIYTLKGIMEGASRADVNV